MGPPTLTLRFSIVAAVPPRMRLPLLGLLVPRRRVLSQSACCWTGFPPGPRRFMFCIYSRNASLLLSFSFDRWSSTSSSIPELDRELLPTLPRPTLPLSSVQARALDEAPLRLISVSIGSLGQSSCDLGSRHVLRRPNSLFSDVSAGYLSKGGRKEGC